MSPRSRRARGTGLVLAALALVACLPSIAQGAETAKLVVTFSPYKLGKETTLNIHVTIGDTNGGVPGPVTNFDTRMPPRLELVGSTLGLAICQPEALLASGLEGCSPNARLGSGSAQVEVPFGPETVGEQANVEALMGPPNGENVGVLLYAEGRSPVYAQSVFPGELLVGSALGESLNTTVPVTPTLPGAPDASVSSMQLSIGPKHLTYYKKVHGKMVGYRPTGVSLPKRCPQGGFLFQTDMTFQDGTHLKVPSTVACPSTHRH